MKPLHKFAGRESTFHLHPLNATFSLIVSVVLTLLIVLVLTLSAK